MPQDAGFQVPAMTEPKAQDSRSPPPDLNRPDARESGQSNGVYDREAPLWTWLGNSCETALPQQSPRWLRETIVSSPAAASQRRNGTVKYDRDQLADFRKAIEEKSEVTKLLAELRGRRACYRGEVNAGKREPNADYEYELREAERRLKHRLKPIEEVIGLAEHLAREGGRVSADYRALLVESGLGHRLEGTVPGLAPVVKNGEPESKGRILFRRPIATLFGLLLALAGIVLVVLIR
jgi:hypothetical protein